LALNNFVRRDGVITNQSGDVSIEHVACSSVLPDRWLLSEDGLIELLLFFFGDCGAVDVRLRLTDCVVDESKNRSLHDWIEDRLAYPLTCGC
jgi:hypothetical protein